MNRHSKKALGQASVEYLLIFAGCVMVIAAGMAAFSVGLDAWWAEWVLFFSKPGP